MPRPLLLVLALLLWTTPAMSMQITDPWPDPAAVRGVQEERVTFLSSDPFVPRDISRAPIRPINARLFLPANAPLDRSVPAVVMLHGSGGMIAGRLSYGPQLAAMGVAVLLVETYDSRRDLATSFIERVLNITETMFVADAYAGLAYLTARAEIDPRKVALVGFSYGGMATEYALFRQLADALARTNARFVGHVAYYAPCIARFVDRRTTGAPLLMLYGSDDDLMVAERCEQTASEMRAGGSEVDIIVYQGAVHQWDGGMPRRTIGRQLKGCRFKVNPDGSVTDENTWLSMSGPFLRKIILGLCTSGTPYPIGQDDVVRAQSNRDLGRFLTRVFSERPPRTR